MLESLLITFRETLEAALIIGIVLGYLKHTEQPKMRNAVWIGVGLGIGGSIVGKILFDLLAGGFSGRAEEIFEGITMLVGAGLLGTLIIWVGKQYNSGFNLKDHVGQQLHNRGWWSIMLLVFISILREGIETVIFLSAAGFASDGSGSLIGAGVGIILAIGVACLLFVWSVRLPLHRFFKLSGIILILFAVGLVAHGVHELQEAGVIPIIKEHVFDINPAVAADGSYPVLHEKGTVGSIIKGLFGYNGNPNLLELIAYIVTLIVALTAWYHATRPK
ncbi:MAG: FTR1 family protein [Victivallaceae bacterium]|nr:FTR1 family protein [Victivallaceae bacterium]